MFWRILLFMEVNDLKRIYKTVNIIPVGTTKADAGAFEAILNQEAQDGWELHSVLPQVNNGTVTNNVAIFTIEVEE